VATEEQAEQHIDPNTGALVEGPPPATDGTAAGQDPAPAATDPSVQAEIDAAVAKALAAHGIEVTPAETQSALDALQSLGEDAEHSTFAERLEQLADRGYQAVVHAEQESPLVKTLITVVGELVEKVA
jgi:hypothetical protein